ncbi:MAG: hypothetical protein ACRDJL_03000, partial [Actinomycetota bacterium]
MGEQHSAFWGSSEDAPIPIGLATPPEPPEVELDRPEAKSATSGPAPNPPELETPEPSGNGAVFRDDYLLRARAQIPRHGWRRTLHLLSGGLINLGPSAAE